MDTVTEAVASEEALVMAAAEAMAMVAAEAVEALAMATIIITHPPHIQKSPSMSQCM